MIDFIMALWGRRTCSWCNYKETDPVARLLGADRYWSEPKSAARGWRKIGWFVYNDLSYKLGIWKLGQRWHRRNHG